MLADDLPAQWNSWSAARRKAYQTELAKAYDVEIAPPVAKPPKPSPFRKKVSTPGAHTEVFKTWPQHRLTSSKSFTLRRWQGASGALIEEITQFYQLHNPGKLQDGSVDKLLKKFEGREKTLLTSIKNKYINQQQQPVAGSTPVAGARNAAFTRSTAMALLPVLCSPQCVGPDTQLRRGISSHPLLLFNLTRCCCR